MREVYSDYIMKFDSPMACYVHDAVLGNGDFGDEETSNGMGDWANRYGKRVLNGDDRGFVSLSKYDDEYEATEAFARIRQELEPRFGPLADAAGLTKLRWEGQEMRGSIWHETDAPKGGDSVSMGTLGMQQLSGYDHGEADAYEVPCTVWGDYCGDTVGRSNYRSLIRDMPDTFIEVTGGYNSQYLAIAADYSGDDAEELLRIMTGLRDQYPLYDEEDHSALEMELAEEAWDGWLKADLLSDLDKLGVDVDVVDEDQLRERFYTLVGEGDSYPYAESADSVVFPGLKEITAQLAAELPHVEEESQ